VKTLSMSTVSWFDLVRARGRVGRRRPAGEGQLEQVRRTLLPGAGRDCPAAVMILKSLLRRRRGRFRLYEVRLAIAHNGWSARVCIASKYQVPTPCTAYLLLLPHNQRCILSDASAFFCLCVFFILKRGLFLKNLTIGDLANSEFLLYIFFTIF
jgi:hypothetical protein